MLLLILIVFADLSAQVEKKQIAWRQVLRQNAEWYSSSEAKQIAGNVLIYQHKSGGWPKNIDMASCLSEKEKKVILRNKKDGKQNLGQPTMDNNATSTQLRFLVKVYNKTKNQKYRESIIKGLRYLLNAQYESGGWPQFYPIKKGYYEHITYNDNAMVNTMTFLRDVMENKKEFAALNMDEQQNESVKIAFDKGVQCMLNTQIFLEGKPTVWCAQHDKITLEPAKARAYELPSFSGAESAEITLLLMAIENPSKEIINAVSGAVNWFEKYKIEGVRVEFFRTNGERDRKVVADANAPLIWGRFYDLETKKPFFCDRDGIKKNTLAEIGRERRGGYGWYTQDPQNVLDNYRKWAMLWSVGNE